MKKFFIEEGIDVIVAFILMLVFKENTILIGILLIYSIIRVCFIEPVAMTFLLNLGLLIVVVEFSINMKLANDLHVFALLPVIMIIIVVVVVQFITIIKRISNRRVEIQSDISNRIKNIILKLFGTFEYITLTFQVILILIYPVILSCAIIFSFSGIYNSLNTYYETQGLDEGIYYSIDNSRLSSVESKGNYEIKNYIELNEKGYIFHSATTYFTIGYGDIIAKGAVTRTVAVVQMILAHILNISFFAVFSSFIYELINREKIIKLISN